MSLLVAVFAALAPALPVRLVSQPEIHRIRDLWLLGVLTLSIVWLASVELWLSLIGLWFILRWRAPGYRHETNEIHQSFFNWLGIGASWLFLRSLPDWVWSYLPWGWLAVAVIQVGVLVYRAGWTEHPLSRVSLVKRHRGTFGSPVITALYLALVAPFCPIWLWPVLLIGFWITSSVHAFLAVLVGMAWVAPSTLLVTLPAVIVGAGLWAWSPSVKGQRIMEWTPRGDSVDGWWARLTVWGLILYHMPGHWWTGHGPSTLERAKMGWAAKYGANLEAGEGHMEVLQLAYEMGLVGVGALAAFLLPVGLGLRLGDPWSAAVVAGAVLSLGHWPCRQPAVGLVWLACCAGVMR